MIIGNTNPFEYYITQQLFNDVNVPGCHTKNLSYENIFFLFNYILLLFHGFIFLGTNIKGKIFSGRVRSHPSHPPQLRACFKNSYFIRKGTLWKQIILQRSNIQQLTFSEEVLLHSCSSYLQTNTLYLGK